MPITKVIPVMAPLIMQAIQDAIDSIVAGAPAGLGTLNEIAEALGNDPNFAQTVMDSLDQKAALIHDHEMADVTGLPELLDDIQLILDAKWNMADLPATALGKSILAAASAAAVRGIIGGSANLSSIDQAEAEAGTATQERMWSSLRVRQNVAAYAAQIIHDHDIADITGLATALDGKATAGLVSGGEEVVHTTDSTIDSLVNGRIIVMDSATPRILTLADPDDLGENFIVFISNIGGADLTVEGTFDNDDTEVTLEEGQSMAISCNGIVHRLLLRGGGAGGSGSVIPISESGLGNGTSTITLVNYPASQDAMILFLGGVPQRKSKFTLSGNTITLLDSAVVASDEYWLVTMLKGGASVVAVEPVVGQQMGTNSAGPYTLPIAPPTPASLSVFVEGILQPRDGTAYSYVGTALTFTESIASTKQFGYEIVQGVGIGVPNAESVGATELKTSDIPAMKTKLQIGDSIPVGAILFSSTGAIFPGYLELNGSTFSSSTYPALYTFLGTTTLPDFRDRVPRHAGTLAGSSGTTQEDAFQGHHHNVYDSYFPGGPATAYWYNGSDQAQSDNSQPRNTTGNPWGWRAKEAIADGVNGTPRIATETRIKSYVGKWLIKAASVPVNSGTVDMLALATDVAGKVNKSDIVGTLISSGNGRIIERGSNANGEYVKFADGTMICRNRIAFRDLVFSAGGSTFNAPGQSTTFPATFISIPTVSFSHTTGWPYGGTPSTSSCGYYVFLHVGGTYNLATDWLAIGRWF